jgi:hypothetical protein
VQRRFSCSPPAHTNIGSISRRVPQFGEAVPPPDFKFPSPQNSLTSTSCCPAKRRKSLLLPNFAMTRIQSLIIIGGLALFVACSGYHRLPEKWVSLIPGAYVGKQGQFDEQLLLNKDGQYEHRLLNNGTLLKTEDGLWTAKDGVFRIELTPRDNGYFTEFYDPRSNTFSTNGQKFISYTYYPVPDGQSFSEITVSTSGQFNLSRTDTQ